jgi:hypothetical protein
VIPHDKAERNLVRLVKDVYDITGNRYRTNHKVQ